MSELRFDGQVAVVTGGGRGLGRAYAELLAERGAAIVINDPGVAASGSETSPAPADECVAAIRAAGGRAVANYASVADRAGAKSIITQALDEFGRLDIVINNAGIPLNKTLEDCETEDYELLMNVHFFGTMQVTKAAWPILKKNGYGRVVNTTSSTIFGLPGWSAYGAAKGAIFAFTRAIAVEGAALGIGVNAIAPGAGTRMMLASGLDEERVQWMQQTLPPAIVAPVAAYLAHSSCSLQGAVLSSAGGRVDRYYIGETDGIYSPSLTIEEVQAKLGAIEDFSSFTPFATTDESVIHAQALQAKIPHN
ncbi:MAG: SDR family NAD(P)-dependent oxidoreductase [Spongiibacteraceae bacterium]